MEGIFDGSEVASRLHAHARIREIAVDLNCRIPRVAKIAFPGASTRELLELWHKRTDKSRRRVVFLGTGIDPDVEDEHAISIDGIRTAVESLLDQGVRVVLVLEEQLDPNEPVRIELEELANGLDVTLLDPHDRFMKCAAGIGPVLHESGFWNETGHRIVGDMLLETHSTST